MESPNENICQDTEAQTESVHPEPVQHRDRSSRQNWNDPAALMRWRSCWIIGCTADTSPSAYAIGLAVLFIIPLMQCIDEHCTAKSLPLTICNLWCASAIVVIAIIVLNLVLAVLLYVKSEWVTSCSILNFTLLIFYFVLGFVLYLDLLSYNICLAQNFLGITFAMIVPGWILGRTMLKQHKLRTTSVPRQNSASQGPI